MFYFSGLIRFLLYNFLNVLSHYVSEFLAHFQRVFLFQRMTWALTIESLWISNVSCSWDRLLTWLRQHNNAAFNDQLIPLEMLVGMEFLLAPGHKIAVSCDGSQLLYLSTPLTLLAHSAQCGLLCCFYLHLLKAVWLIVDV